MALIPTHEPLDEAAFEALVALLRGRRVTTLTGAGCSTESGIPDYRGPVTRQKARNPIQYLEFMRKPEARQRYWARSAVGWPRFRLARPNETHEALARLERVGALHGIITQNVDRLHHVAGSHNVVELHGALARVKCTECGVYEDRDAVQARILRDNPTWPPREAELAPDGDAELTGEVIERFVVPACLACGGVLKPYVVFFGENVPKPTVEAAWAMVDASEVLLVVGSSLAIYSGYRFVLGAVERGQDVVIVNLGETRGDGHARLCVQGRAGEVMARLADVLG